jgi:hypothetical protein
MVSQQSVKMESGFTSLSFKWERFNFGMRLRVAALSKRRHACALHIKNQATAQSTWALSFSIIQMSAIFLTS